MVNVVVTQPRRITVSTNAVGTAISPQAVTIRNDTTLISANTPLRLENLTNVDANNEVSGATLIFDANTGIWVAQPLSANLFSMSIDSGTF